MLLSNPLASPSLPTLGLIFAGIFGGSPSLRRPGAKTHAALSSRLASPSLPTRGLTFVGVFGSSLTALDRRAKTRAAL
jgi:hypothetical protein